MSDESNQNEAELDLEASDISEGDAGDSASTTDIDTDVSNEGEETATLELEDADKADEVKGVSNVAAQNRNKQIETWTNRYYEGEVELEKIPKWIQKEIEKADQTQESVDQLVKKAIADEREEAKFSQLQGQLNSQGLTASEAAAIKAEYSDLRVDGVAKYKALQKAMKLAGVTADKSTGSSKKAKMRLPKSGGKVRESSFDESKPFSEIKDNLSFEERMEHLEALKHRQLKA